MFGLRPVQRTINSAVIVKIHQIFLDFLFKLLILVTEVYMKRKNIIYVFMAALVVSVLVSCLSNQPVDNARNSGNSLDWEGVYTGTIPSASGPGINVRLKLNTDQSFELSYDYIDRSDSPVNWTGSFKWNENGSVIILDIVNAPPYYKPAENGLIQLDMSGEIITGTLADNYVLKKE
jgi:uncharacterized lipoprotein NlpE involved in copper resistance